MSGRPVIRAMRFGDVPAVAAMMREAHAASRYARWGFNDKAAKALLTQAVQRHPSSLFAAVAERGDGALDGFVVGLLQPLYHVIEATEATDLFLHAKPGSHGATGARLLRAMHKWAAERGAHVIRQGNTDAITDPAASGALLRRAGMRQTGSVYEKEV